jgi:hypothetical protein
MAESQGPGHGLRPGRLRVWATPATCNWLRWLKENTCRNSSRSVEAAIELLVVVEAERMAGGDPMVLRKDGTLVPLRIK